MTTQYPATPSTFVASATLDITPPAGTTGIGFTTPLPAIDPANEALTVQNLSEGAAFCQFGNASTIPAGTTVTGSFRVESGRTLLVPTAAGEAANIGVTLSATGSIVVTRGTVATATVFQ
jgi:hypothetical protein